jgi:hypothetical protein
MVFKCRMLSLQVSRLVMHALEFSTKIYVNFNFSAI